MKTWLKNLYARFLADLAKAHKSATIWFNGIGVAVMAALPLAQEQLPQLQEYLPPELYHYAMGAVLAGNILLRFKTRCALSEK